MIDLFHYLKKKIVFYLNYPQQHKLLHFKDIRYAVRRFRIFRAAEKRGFEKIPVFIISYNRLSYLKQMIEWLELGGYRNIIIIDNASTFPPLMEYYAKCPYKIIRMQENLGHMVFWRSPVFDKYRENFYIVTDPDLEIVSECPNDYVKIFWTLLKRHPYVKKVGFSLKIDDIGEETKFYSEVCSWEKRFYELYLKKENAYIADIDTTFALYVPDEISFVDNFYCALRTGYPYTVRHLPWYKAGADVTNEDIFYSRNKENGWWDPALNFVKEEASMKNRK